MTLYLCQLCRHASALCNLLQASCCLCAREQASIQVLFLADEQFTLQTSAAAETIEVLYLLVVSHEAEQAQCISLPLSFYKMGCQSYKTLP